MMKWKSHCSNHASTGDLKDLTTDVTAEGACQHEHAACCLFRRPQAPQWDELLCQICDLRGIGHPNLDAVTTHLQKAGASILAC